MRESEEREPEPDGGVVNRGVDLAQDGQRVEMEGLVRPEQRARLVESERPAVKEQQGERYSEESRKKRHRDTARRQERLPDTPETGLRASRIRVLQTRT